MKKSFIVALAIIAVVALVLLAYKGTIGKPDPAENENRQAVPGKTENNVKSNEDYSAIGFIKIGAASGDILKKLGQPEKKSEPEVWGADGEEHQTWYYHTKGIELDIVGTEGKQAVNMITISSPCILKTKRSIGIGSTRDAVLKAYKKEIDLSETSPEIPDSDEIVAGTVYDGVIFSFTDKHVSSIFVGAAAE